MKVKRILGIWARVALLCVIGLGSCAHPSAEADKEEATVKPVSEEALAPAVGAHPAPDATLSASRAPRAIDTAARRPSRVVQRGTGEFYNPIDADLSALSSVQAPDASANGPADGVVLNYVDAEISEVLDSVLGEILRLNYSIDPGVSGKMTVQSNRRLPPDQVLTLLEGELNARGFGIGRRGNVLWITTRDKLRQTGTLTGRLKDGSSAPGEGLEIVPLSYVSAAEVARLLQPVAPAGAVVQVDPARNAITLSGAASERQRLRELIAVFDVDWMKGMSFELVPVRTGDPEALAADVEAVLGGEESPIGDLIRLVPIRRLGAIVIISPRPQYLDRARFWITQLDPKGSASGRQLYTYEALHVPAAHLAKLLSQLVGASTGDSSASTSISDILAPGANAAEIASPDFGGREASSGAAAQPPGNFTMDRTRIITDEINDTLLIVATPQEYELISEAVLKLDVEPLQVLIEATIAEVRLKDELRYGLQWFFADDENAVTLSQVDSGDAAQIFPGFSYLYSEGADTRVVLNALDSLTDVNIISSPQLFVRDNGTARLQVGDQVPVATQAAIATDTADARIVNSIEFKDTGVILTVTPRINSQGYVQLDIEQEVSTVVTTTTSGIDSPTIQTRRFKSSVTVKSGQTVALGGLISETLETGSDGVPVLSRMPVVGPLFGERRNIENKTELLALIRPRVVANASQTESLSDEIKTRFRNVRPIAESRSLDGR